MKVFEFTITDPVGIHTRPAGQLVALTRTFSSTIRINGNNKSVDGKKMIAIMCLGIKHGQTIQVQVEGEDEEAAFTALEQFFKTNL